jgi:membrane-associated phospholipid phosphatase
LPAAAAATTLASGDHRGTGEFAGAAAVTLGATFGLKYLVDERRPNGGRHSFPSGHTSISFCSAEFLRRRYGPACGLPAYALAAFVAWSRVEAKEHYVHDVLAGAAIGIVSSRVLATPYRGHTLGVVAGSEGRAGWRFGITIAVPAPGLGRGGSAPRSLSRAPILSQGAPEE